MTEHDPFFIPDWLRRDPAATPPAPAPRPARKFKMPAPRRKQTRKAADQIKTLGILGFDERAIKRLSLANAKEIIRSSLSPAGWQRRLEAKREAAEMKKVMEK